MDVVGPYYTSSIIYVPNLRRWGGGHWPVATNHAWTMLSIRESNTSLLILTDSDWLEAYVAKTHLSMQKLYVEVTIYQVLPHCLHRLYYI